MIATLTDAGLSVSLDIDARLRVWPRGRLSPKWRAWIKANREALYREVLEREWKAFDRLRAKYVRARAEQSDPALADHP